MKDEVYPVILIEGLDGVGKSTLVKALAKKLSATLIASPPKIIDPNNNDKDLRVRMDYASMSVRREYYRYANFHASLLIDEARHYAPVVLDRYWSSTASFATIDECDPDWEPIGVWPQGFIEPDIMLLLTVNEEKRLQRMTERGLEITDEEEKLEQGTEYREQILQAFRGFEPIEIDTSDLDANEVLNEAMFWLHKAEILHDQCF